MQDFLNYIFDKKRISKEAIAALKACCVLKKLPKNHILLKEGQIAQNLYFIEQGVARSFYYHENKEVSSWFYKEGQLLTAWNSFYTRMAAFEYIELLEDSTLYALPYDSLQKLYEEHPSMQTFGRLMVEEQLSFLDSFYKGFNFMSAKEKYDLLIDYFPDITLRINLGYIASFLGISQETLSRIRRVR